MADYEDGFKPFTTMDEVMQKPIDPIRSLFNLTADLIEIISPDTPYLLEKEKALKAINNVISDLEEKGFDYSL